VLPHLERERGTKVLSSLQDALLYAVIDCQQHVETDTPLPGAAALDAMASYFAQSGAYVEGQAPYIECLYGGSEVAQGFVRACCVHGGMVALQRQPECIVLDREGNATAVRFADGQAVQLKHMVVSDGLLVTAAQPERLKRQPDAGDPATGPDSPRDSVSQGGSPAAQLSAEQRVRAVARAVAVLDRPLLGQSDNLRMVIPPGKCGTDAAVNVWQCSSGLRVCAAGQVVLYMSTPDTAGDGEAGLRACLAALVPDIGGHATRSIASADQQAEICAESGTAVAPGCQPGQLPPHVLLSCFFRQALAVHDECSLPGNVARCSLPGAAVTMDAQVEEAAATFASLFPSEPFLAPKEAAGHAVDELDPLDVALQDLGLHSDGGDSN
jgi:GDP dissociation inhibitor